MEHNSLRSRSRRLTSVDLPFLVAVLLLLAIGLATLYSAGFAKALQKTGNSYYYISRQGMYALIGLIGMGVLSWIPYKLYRKISVPFYIGSIALLIAAMSAKGTSVISNIEQIDRGYEDIDVRLNALGARITRQ